MSNIEKPINIEKIQSRLDKLLDEVDQTIAEFREDPVIDELQDKIGTLLYQSPAFRALHHAYEYSIPESEVRRYQISSGLRETGDKYLLEHFNHIDGAKRFILSKAPSTGSEDVEWYRWRDAVREVIYLEDPVITEMYERIQCYRNEIETLRREQS